MTVNTELCYQELIWTGAQTVFAPGFVANDALHVSAKYRDGSGVLSNLVRDTQIRFLRDTSSGLVTAVPVSMPAAPGTVIFRRDTPAIQETDFANLKSFDPALHTRLHDAAAMRSAEARRDNPAVIDFPPAAIGRLSYGNTNVAGADPRASSDFVTLAYFTANAGIDAIDTIIASATAALNAIVTSATNSFNAIYAQCQTVVANATSSFNAQIASVQATFAAAIASIGTSVTAAATSATASAVSATASAASAVTSQAWAENATDVTTGHPSSKTWATTASAYAAAAATSASMLANTDYGDFSADDGSGPSDYGDFS